MCSASKDAATARVAPSSSQPSESAAVAAVAGSAAATGSCAAALASAGGGVITSRKLFPGTVLRMSMSSPRLIEDEISRASKAASASLSNMASSTGLTPRGSPARGCSTGWDWGGGVANRDSSTMSSASMAISDETTSVPTKISDDSDGVPAASGSSRPTRTFTLRISS